MDEKRGLIVILISSLIAIITSTYLVYQHYSDTSSFCDITQDISCDIVNRSLYSEVFGIPVSGLSLLTFYIVTVLSIFALKNKNIFGLNKKAMFDIIFWLMLIGVIAALYLIYIEAFVLYAVCPLCVLLDILILIVLITIIKLKKQLGRRR